MPFSMEQNRSRYLSTVILMVLLVAVALVYSNTLHAEFQFDDDLYISGSKALRSPIEYLGKTAAWNVLTSGIRPLTMLTFSMNYMVGGLAVEGYHAVNIILHMIAVVLVYLFLRRVMGGDHPEGGVSGRTVVTAWIGAAIFALHPVQTQAVTYIVQRSEVIASLLYVASLLLLMRFLEEKGWKALGYWIFGMVCFLLGWGSKEIIVTMPLVYLLCVIYLGEKKDIGKAVKGVLPIAAVGAVLGIRVVLSMASGGSEHAGFGIEGLGAGDYFYTQMRVLVTYLRLIVFPVGQNLDYDYPIYRKFLDPGVVVPFLFWAALVVLAFFSLKVRGRWRRHVRIMGFGVLWFLIVLSPTSTFVPLVDVINEHRLYLALLGVAMSVIAGVDMVLVRAREKYGYEPSWKAGAVLLLAVMVAPGVATYERNRVWSTKLSLWEDVVSKSPRKSRPRNNLGQILLKSGRYVEAEQELLRAIELDPDHVSSYNNLGLVYQGMNDLEKAEKNFLAAVRKDGRFIDARINLGVVYARRKEFDRAIDVFLKAKEIEPSNPGIYNNMAIVYAMMQNTALAERYFLEAIRFDPSYAEAYTNLGNLYSELKRYDDALQNFRKALSLNPENHIIRYRLANLYLDMGRNGDAEREYRLLLGKAPFLAGQVQKRMLGMHTRGR